MGFRSLPVLVTAALAVTACARHPAPYHRYAAPVTAPPQVLQYPGEPAPHAVPAPYLAPAPLPKPQATAGAPYVIPAQPVSEGAYESEPAYLLDSGDRLRIVVFGQQGLTNTYAVDAAGNIAMPLIGAVAARGLTPPQLARAIAAQLRRSYVRDPSVTVEVVAYRPFFILGEVNNPGQYPYVAKMTVETAVAIAGGFAPRAHKKRISVRRRLNGHFLKFDAPITFEVHPGDTIRIKERWF